MVTRLMGELLAGPSGPLPSTLAGRDQPTGHAPVSGRGRYTTAAGVLALLYCVGGLGALAAVTFPLTTHPPVGMARVLGVLELCAGLALATARHRVNARGLHAALAIRVGIVSALVAYSATTTAVALAGLSYLALASFAGCFLALSAARVHVALIIAGASAGMLACGVGHLTLVWIVIAVAVVAAAEVLGHLFAQLRSQAATDPLTGLANRTSFRAAAEREMGMATRSRAPLTLVLIDLDDFKSVNDTRGHSAGDILLIELAAAWLSELRGADLLARYGGDEFALLLPDATIAGAECVLSRLRASHAMRWSAGVAVWEMGATVDQLFESADHDLYRAKRDRPMERPTRAMNGRR
ncbi:MAG: hypothetical protein QOJ62_632 [Actinomycetota bacterium]|nr:hypothetical protein [Actinomycetota bacterium]